MDLYSNESIFKWCHEEIAAFKCRAPFITMKINLNHRIEEEEFSFLGSSGH